MLVQNTTIAVANARGKMPVFMEILHSGNNFNFLIYIYAGDKACVLHLPRNTVRFSPVIMAFVVSISITVKIMLGSRASTMTCIGIPQRMLGKPYLSYPV